MRLKRARVQRYRSIRDSDWFDVEHTKTILVGPNEAGKTALLQALQRLNPGEGVSPFGLLRDYPRSELNDLDSGQVDPASVCVVQGTFALEDDDLAAVSAIDPSFVGCTYTFQRYLDDHTTHRIDGAPECPTYSALAKDLARLSAHVDKRAIAPEEAGPSPSQALNAITKDWLDQTVVSGSAATSLQHWLQTIALPLLDDEDSAMEQCYDRLFAAYRLYGKQQQVLDELRSRLPVFVYFNNYFRVRPLIHLDHLATRLEHNSLDDDSYDFGNLCFLKLLGFSARELSDLGKVAEPEASDAAGFQSYRDQLDKRSYRLNAASVRLTDEIRRVWQPDATRGEADVLRVRADQQYLKVVVEDDLGVEVELDQRSEGFQWLVSFFIVFFAEAADSHRNAILLLDEPGLSLHGLKQREFRATISRLAENNQTLFTTHSPFLVGPDELDMVRVVEMKDRRVGTVVHTTITADDSDALLPLQEAFGYDLAQSLFAQHRSLVLEGLTDYWYLEATAELL